MYTYVAGARVSWRTSRRVIWTVPAVGRQNQKERERERKERSRNAAKYGRNKNPQIHESADL